MSLGALQGAHGPAAGRRPAWFLQSQSSKPLDSTLAGTCSGDPVEAAKQVCRQALYAHRHIQIPCQNTKVENLTLYTHD